MMKKLLFWGFLLTFMIRAEDLMVVRGGREIRGRVLNETPTHVSFYTDYGKKIEVHKSRISVILRKGNVLAVNPTVGSLVGIKPESDVMQGNPQTAKAPATKPKASMGESTEQAHNELNEVKSNVTMEPVTENASGKSQTDRSVAAASSSESIANSELGFRVGPVIGATQSNASAATSTTSRLGAEAGVVTEFPFIADLFIQPELLLSQAGYKTDSAVVKYSYLKLPVLLKYKYPLNEQVTLSGLIGPSLGFRSDAKSESSGTSTDMKATTKSTIMGFDLGVGGEYSLSSKMGVFLNMRYSLQLNNLDTTVGATSSVKLRQLSFLSGVMFNL